MLLEIFVKSNSKESKVICKNNIYYIYTKSPAKEGKANKEIVKLLSKYLDMPKSNIFIKKGLKSKIKLIEVKE